ncbi:DNA-directed RNA polymerase I subunit RPA43 [Galendromus occidentalis]|uniref:DNA-directed RNA polymerase I subunit RPA43 n=1 Tax=Galendromus occidentalis TaxID=34638 RepID=A0AAJ6QUJ2_9ACAR|nr:DNA-directed RNA polymerase I subunit RPA43 [Galendromus occidentalis]
MASSDLPDDMSCLLIVPKEQLWINLYPNALTNVRRALKTFLDQRIGRFCNKNNGILLSYTDLKFRAKHFQVFEDYPMCRFPVSISATYYKPEPGTMATGTITRIDHISVTCLIHGLIHVSISLRKSVNFDTWCAMGQQIVFLIKGGEMHYKGVRLQAIVTQECVDKMQDAFPASNRKRTFSSSSADSAATTPIKPKAKKRRISEILNPESRGSDADFFDGSDSYDFGSPDFTSTQRRHNIRASSDTEGIEITDSEEPQFKDEVLSSQDEVTLLEASSKRRKKSRSNLA